MVVNAYTMENTPGEHQTCTDKSTVQKSCNYEKISHLLATGPELPTHYSLENPSDFTHSLTLWQPDLSLPRTIGKPLCFDAGLVNKLVPCAWLLSGALEVWSLRLRLRLRLFLCPA